MVGPHYCNADDKYETLCTTMEESLHSSDDCSRRACGVLALMEKFQTYFGLNLSVLIFSLMEQLSVTTLQGVTTKVDDCYFAVKVTIRGLKKLKTFFKPVKEETKDKCDPVVLPRQRQPLRRLNDGAANHAFQSVEDLYRREYFEAIEEILKKDLHSKMFSLSEVFRHY